MEVFTLSEQRSRGQGDEACSSPDSQSTREQTSSQRGNCCPCPLKGGNTASFNSTFGLIAQSIIAFLMTTFLVLDLAFFIDKKDKDTLPSFGRLACLFFSLYIQKLVTSESSGAAEVSPRKLLGSLVAFTLILLIGNVFWLIEMQQLSQLATKVVNYTAIQPVLLTIELVVGFYYLRKSLKIYRESWIVDDMALTQEEHPKIEGAVALFGVAEGIFGVIFATLMSFVLEMDSELAKRCICLIVLFSSVLVNEMAIGLCKEKKGILVTKAVGFFVTLVSCQLTWWISYYVEYSISLYGLTVGFLGLVLGVLYVIEMSLIIAQLNSFESSFPKNESRGRSGIADDREGEVGDDNYTSDPASLTESESGKDEPGFRLINRKCVVGLTVFLQVGLALLSIGLVASKIVSPDKPRNEELLENWVSWATGFFAAVLLNQIVLFQRNVYYLLVSICNGAFCINFCLGCVLSYQGAWCSVDTNGFPDNFALIGSVWVPFFVMSHLDFIRLTRLSLDLERKQIRRSRDSRVTLFVVSGIATLAAIAAIIPTTNFWFFPGKTFSLLTFPSLTFIAETIFYFGKKCRGPFLVTFTAFSLGSGYGQTAWYISVILNDKGTRNFLGVTKPWLIGMGLLMGLVTWIYVIRFLFIIVTKWGQQKD